MSVTYQDSYHVKFSVNVCGTSGQHYHPIFWQCVWQIMWTVSLYHPLFRQCPWHIWIIPFSDNVCDILGQVTLSNFLSMFVTYQDNLIIQFSDKVNDKSGKLCHGIIPVSDNVRDISVQLLSQIFWQCVWRIRKTVSLYQPIFQQCLWQIRQTTLPKLATEKKNRERKKRENNGGKSGQLWQLRCCQSTA